MEEINKTEDVTLDTYTKNMEDQELKGILLKLKNEIRKPDVTWDIIKPLLASLYEKDSKVFSETAILMIK